MQRAAESLTRLRHYHHQWRRVWGLRQTEVTVRERSERPWKYSRTNLANILLHPFQSLALIFETIVKTSTLLDFLTSEKSEWSHAVVKGHHYDIVARCFDQVSPVVIGIRKLRKASALNEEVNREFLPRRDSVGWGVDVHKKTVFRLRSLYRSAWAFRHWDTNGTMLVLN